MPTERIHWIDIARGIGILFVIYAHVLGDQGIRYFFYSFHMPFFFFLSGMVYDRLKYINFFVFLRKSARSLLIPYLIFALIFYILWIIQLKHFNLLSFENIKQFLSIFYANSNNGLMAFNNILWFLPALFLTRILFAVITNSLTKIKTLVAILMLLSVFGYLFSIFASNIKLPLGIETAITAVVFYGVGFLWNHSQKSKLLISKYKYLLFIFLLLINIIISTIDFHNSGRQIDMRLNHLNNYFLFYIAAFSGIFAWICFSLILNKNRLLEMLGKKTLILFVWHLYLFTYLELILRTIFGLKLTEDLKPLIPLLYTSMSTSIILLANSIYNKLLVMLTRGPSTIA